MEKVATADPKTLNNYVPIGTTSIGTTSGVLCVDNGQTTPKRNIRNYMKIPKSAIHVESVFSIWLWKSRGKIYMADVQGEIYDVLNKDATPLSEEQYRGIQ
jgi:hypothetical protein